MNITAAAHVLIVDDDRRLRELLQRYLHEQGFNVHVAADGRELDKELARCHIDLIVLDLMLPGEDGLSICRRLRGQGTETPIIMLTARGDEIDRIVGLEIGADDYLPKPGNPRELVARITPCCVVAAHRSARHRVKGAAFVSVRFYWSWIRAACSAMVRCCGSLPVNSRYLPR